MNARKIKIDEILRVQSLENKYQGLVYIWQESKNKPTIAQATSIIRKLTKVKKPKISVPAPPSDRHDYKSIKYSHNTKSEFVPICYRYERLGHIRLHCYDPKNVIVSKSSKGKVVENLNRKIET